MGMVRTLRQWRILRGLSAGQLAARAGLTKSAVLRLETGKSRGWPQTWHAVANALGVELEQIAEARALLNLPEHAEQESGMPDS